MGLVAAIAAISPGTYQFARAAGSKQPGGAQKDQGIGAVSFLTALSSGSAIFTFQLLLFLLLRNKLDRIFKPKTYLVPQRERTAPPPRSFVKLIKELWNVGDQEIIRKCGLDAYFFLRYLKTLLVIFIPIASCIIPVLVPLNYIDGRGHELNSEHINQTQNGPGQVTGLDTLAWGNIKASNTDRYWAHLVMSILVVAWVCLVFLLEMRVYTKVRQDYLLSADHRSKASATTVLVSSIPERWLTEETLKEVFNVFPGGVRHVWINRDLSSILEKISRRDAVHHKLEAAETCLVQAAQRARNKGNKLSEGRLEQDMGPGVMVETEKASLTTQSDIETQWEAPKQRHSTQTAGKSTIISDNSLNTSYTSPGILKFTIEEELECGTSMASRKVHPSKVPMFSQGPRNPRDKTTEPTLWTGIGREVIGAVSRAGAHVEETVMTTNGFVPITRIDEPSPGGEGDWIEKNANVPNAPDISVIDKDKAQMLRHKHDLVATRWWQFWRPPSGILPSPVPQHGISSGRGSSKIDRGPESHIFCRRFLDKILAIFNIKDQAKDKPQYPKAFNDSRERVWEQGLWHTYLNREDRPTHRLPLFGVRWLPGIAPFSQKVDTISWCRKKLARLNVEIKEDQKHEERFPLLDSAFIQFNSQVAAHMACQSKIHYRPELITTTIVETCPKDIIWENIGVSYFGGWLRSVTAAGILSLMISLWSVPVAWTGALSQIDQLIPGYEWLSFIEEREGLRNAIRAIAGLLPATMLAVFLYLLPLFLESLAEFKGAKTNSMKDEFVQKFYFIFLFVQVFLVVSIASFFTASVSQFATNVKELQKASDVLDILARNLPKAANYFYSYMLLQSLSTSSATLLQVGALIKWYLLSPAIDLTAREKWARSTGLNSVKWGSVFPVYTNFACIALIYCIISPLISVFAILAFGLLWLAQRYAIFYVNKFEYDTGGALYPRAINQTFTGVYTMELCISGLFFVTKDENGRPSCIPHGIIMLFLLILTVLYQTSLNAAFGPLFRYLPVALKDEVVRQDEAARGASDLLLKSIGNDHNVTSDKKTGSQSQAQVPGRLNYTMTDAFYGKFPTELGEVKESLRDELIRRAFRHGAVCAREPVVWIPRDDLGISEDEIQQTKRYTENIRISSRGTALDGKGRVIFGGNPPDFSALDLLHL